MAAVFEAQALPGVVLCRTRLFRDARGYFVERYHAREYARNGIDRTFVQLNHSFSTRGVLRGMHYQLGHPQAKLVSVAVGRVYDVVVDVRRGSPTFGRWLGVELSAEGGEQLFIPEGYAHGFCVLSDEAHFLYQCSDYYSPPDEAGFHWASALPGIRWPVPTPRVSEKDSALPGFGSLPPERLPRFGGPEQP